MVAITREVIDGVIRDVIANLGKNHINNITETHKRWMIVATNSMPFILSEFMFFFFFFLAWQTSTMVGFIRFFVID